jgi:hypothetical protein
MVCLSNLRGKIYAHNNFTFKDGTAGGNKLLVLINELANAEGPWIFCKTTTKNKRNFPQGCHSQHNIYAMLPKEDFFKEPTCIQFDLHFFCGKQMLKDKIAGHMTELGQLRDQTTRALLNCVKKSPDISKKELQYL